MNKKSKSGHANNGRSFIKYKFLFIVILTISVGVSLMAIEQAKYQTITKEGQFEVREYESHILAEVEIAGDMEGASNQAFRPLFRYISGENRSQTKVAMTAPVSQEQASEKISMTTPVSQERSDGAWAISFMMPADYTMETIPLPSNHRVKLREVPVRKVATVKYSGRWTESGYLKHKLALEKWIASEGLIANGDAIWARFNSPYTPWFMRRNEVQIPVLETLNTPKDQAQGHHGIFSI